LNIIKRFWTQPGKRYRNFQIVFTILTLNFAIPSLSYILTPDAAIGQFARLNELLGGEIYTAPENAGFFWRYLGISNVMTLALMCFLLQLNLRRFFPVLLPLTFMKGSAATFWLAGYAAHTEKPAFLAAAVLDYVTSAAFLFFTLRARAEIDNMEDPDLLPPPRAGFSPGGWTRTEEKWRDSLLSAMIPEIPGTGLPGFAGADQECFWPDFRRNAPFKLRAGFRFSVWVLTFLPVFSRRGGAPFHRLSTDRQDLFLERVSSCRSYLLRQLAQLIKLVACFGYFRDMRVRTNFPGAAV